MQGTIAFDGTLSGGISGGGGGGSEVTITPVLTEGEKIADYEIDGTPGELYAPTPPVVPEHIVNDIHGFSYTHYPSTEIARYTIDGGVEQSLFAPDYETTWEAYPGVDQDYTIGLLRCFGSTFYVKIPYYQKPLTAGTNITIDPLTNTISASGGSGVNYSTTEQDTGITWIDGSHIYQKTVKLENIALAGNTFILKNISDYVSDISVLISYEAIVHNKTGGAFYIMPYSIYANVSTYSINVAIAGNEINISTGSASGAMNTDIYVTFRYTKSV